MANPIHDTLVASTVMDKTLDAKYAFVTVINHDSASPIYFTVNAADPTVEGDGSDVVLPGGYTKYAVPLDEVGVSAPQVHLISAGTPTFTLRGD